MLNLNRIKSVEIKENGIMDRAVDFVLANQLKDRQVWKKTVEVFSTLEDSEKGRWRGEYFGKQMRGASLIYAYTKDEELYEILTETVTDLLSRQDEYGRFSTYEVENEFTGWDTWCRKYVLVGLLYYADICKDEELKAKVINACKKHLDYILLKIGDGENQMKITETSLWWGCVNSCTILEPTLETYKRTGDERYLNFAKYIISTGGSSDCNLVELPLSSELCPYQYPVTKAYEMMSFYEGLLAFYEITGEKKYYDTVCSFVQKVKESDITIIGCAGCTHELFDNSAKVQTEYQENIMQETCVTVTWMRLNRRLFEITGDKKYIDNFEKSGYNALYGSLNTEMNDQFSMEQSKWVKGMAFDSYSPLYMNTRGRGIGGYNEFASGGYSGCCVAIGACAIALMPLTAIMQSGDKIYINTFFNGDAHITDRNGKRVTIKIESNYPADGLAKVSFEDDCMLSLYLRKPDWCNNMMVDGQKASEEYFVINRAFTSGESIEIALDMKVEKHVLNGKIAFTYGPLTLASDEQKSKIDLTTPLSLSEKLGFKKVETKESELVRFELLGLNSGDMVLTDYQSCGKKWLSVKPLMTVWFNGK
ncbi:MAG: glycoside hydrolase family 127 protein [Clostridia bacterium]|nr:glycoside hydrolase family 127 protein [Clostridia bacterium]